MNINEFTQDEQPKVHEVIYILLKQQGVTCDGIETEKDGNIRVINPSGKVDLNVEDVKQVINDLPQTESAEQLVERKIKEMVSVHALKQNGG